MRASRIKDLRKLGRKEEMLRVLSGLCPSCSVVIKDSHFHDELSKKEYLMSGLCQKCQCGVFGR